MAIRRWPSRGVAISTFLSIATIPLLLLLL